MRAEHKGLSLHLSLNLVNLVDLVQLVETLGAMLRGDRPQKVYQKYLVIQLSFAIIA